MRFTVDIDILASRDRVLPIYTDKTLIKHWQNGVMDFEILSGDPGESGSSVQLKQKLGKQTVTVIETLENNAMPDEITFTYSAPQLWYRTKNNFIQSGPNKTTWVRECEFKCAGIYKVISLLAPGRFRKQLLQEMERFKRFCEDKVYSEVVF